MSQPLWPRAAPLSSVHASPNAARRYLTGAFARAATILIPASGSPAAATVALPGGAPAVETAPVAPACSARLSPTAEHATDTAVSTATSSAAHALTESLR
ncbi:hypothetical protein GCM10023147_41390 [Tsukamurella soli]|uniref:Uncharacterized protein n=1 Tax=Tsukamurella soli TaxID=644556 RepID=A0ABP8K6Y7_9ACTN